MNFDDSKICPICFSEPNGSCLVIIPGKGARPCICQINRRRASIIATIPERNLIGGEAPVLEKLQPMVPEEHQMRSDFQKKQIIKYQKKIIRYAQQNPFASMVLCGTNKIGKSQIGYAVYYNAFENFRQVKCFNMKQLLNDFARFARGEIDGNSEKKFEPRLTVEMLTGSSKRWTLLIDEFHAPVSGLTESQTTTTFEILDAIKAHGHQLIILSNRPLAYLRQGYRRHDEFLGDSIISRIQERAVVDEFFLPEIEEEEIKNTNE